MLIIRREQMQAFDMAAEQAFVEKMTCHCRKQFPDETAHQGDAQLQGWIRGAITRARVFQLRSERDLCAYLNLGMLLGPGFIDLAENVWMKNTLRDPNVAMPTLRMARLTQAVRYRMETEEHNQRLLREYWADEGAP